VDEENEVWKFIAGIVAIIAFVISTFYAWMELKYATAGKTAQGTIDRVTDMYSVRRRTAGQRGRTVHYHFRDASGEVRRDSDGVPLDWVRPPSGKVTIEYLDDTSRLAGNRKTGALVVFFGSLAMLGVGGFLFWRHVREATRPSAPAPPKPPRYRPYGY
jgi:hypothetical protein